MLMEKCVSRNDFKGTLEREKSRNLPDGSCCTLQDLSPVRSTALSFLGPSFCRIMQGKSRQSQLCHRVGPLER